MISIDDVIQTWLGAIESDRAFFDVALDSAFAGSRLGSVLDYYSENVTTDDYSLLMISEGGQSGKWVGMPEQADITFSLSITGAVFHDDPQVCAKLIRTLAAQTWETFNNRHAAGLLVSGDQYLFHGDDGANPPLPLRSIDFGEARLSGATVRAFVGQYEGKVRYGAQDFRPPEVLD